MTTPILPQWQGFLPRGAVVMARRRSGIQVAEDAEVAPSFPCGICRASAHLTEPAGNPAAQILFVIEVEPGPTTRFEPYSDAAGQLLERMIEAMGLKRADVSILGWSRCAGSLPDDREEFLRQIQSLAPKVVVALGDTVSSRLGEVLAVPSAARGRLHRAGASGVVVMPTLALSSLLENVSLKREAWGHLRIVATELGIQIPQKGGGNPAPENPK